MKYRIQEPGTTISGFADSKLEAQVSLYRSPDINNFLHAEYI